MKNKLFFALAIAATLLMASCGGEQKGQKPADEKIDAIEVSIDSLLVDASALEGKIVKFSANVDHACKHGGNRLTVFGSEEGKVLKIDGSENLPAFQSSLDGKKVEIIGTVKKVTAAHTADCEDHEVDEAPEFTFAIECVDYKEIE